MINMKTGTVWEDPETGKEYDIELDFDYQPYQRASDPEYPGGPPLNPPIEEDYVLNSAEFTFFASETLRTHFEGFNHGELFHEDMVSAVEEEFVNDEPEPDDYDPEEADYIR